MVTKKNISYLAVALTIHVHCSDNNHKNISLHEACRIKNNIEAIKYLIGNNADINAKNQYGYTPLHLTCDKKNNIEVIKYLIDNNADINAMDVNNNTPLYLACTIEDNMEVIKYLIDNKANVNANNKYSYTPFHLACDKEKNREVIKYLIDNKANVNAKNQYGYTPLHLTCDKKNNREVVQYLIVNNADINAKNQYGYTPLHKACYIAGDIEVIKCLVENKADINAKDKNGSTPFRKAYKAYNTQHSFYKNNIQVIKSLKDDFFNKKPELLIELLSDNNIASLLKGFSLFKSIKTMLCIFKDKQKKSPHTVPKPIQNIIISHVVADSEHKELLSNAKMLLQKQDCKSYIEEKKYTFDGFNKITQFLHHPNSN